MGKYGGDDIVWLALGIGALYSSVKLTKPLVDTYSTVGENVSKVSNAAGDLGADIFRGLDSGIVKPVFQTLAGENSGSIKDTVKTVADVAGPIIFPFPTAAVNLVKTVKTAISSSSSSKKKSSTVLYTPATKAAPRNNNYAGYSPKPVNQTASPAYMNYTPAPPQLNYSPAFYTPVR